MSETANILKRRFREERVSVKPNINFEAALHAYKLDKLNEIDQNLLHYDFRNAHVWNSGLKSRLRPTNPQFLAIDSLNPLLTPDTPLDTNQKLEIWKWLPGNPDELNEQKKIYVVMGDSNFWMVARSLIDTLPYSEDERSYLLKQAVELDHVTQNNGTSAFSNPENITLAADVFFPYPIWEYVKYKDDIQNNGKEPTQMTRRTFLRRGLLGFAAVNGMYLGARFGSDAVLASTDSKQTADTAQRVQELTRNRVLFSADYDSIVGRTALLLAKAMETANQIGISVHGSVVMGNAHAPEAGQALKDENYRIQKIRKMAEGQIHLLSQLFQNYPSGVFDRIHDMYLNQLTTITLVNAKEPPVTKNRSKDLLQSITKETTFISAEIQQAIQGL